MVCRSVCKNESASHIVCFAIVDLTTLSVVADFAIDGLRRERNLMDEHVARRSSPICDQAVIASNPLRRDIGVDLYPVRLAIV